MYSSHLSPYFVATLNLDKYVTYITIFLSGGPQPS